MWITAGMTLQYKIYIHVGCAAGVGLPGGCCMHEGVPAELDLFSFGECNLSLSLSRALFFSVRLPLFSFLCLARSVLLSQVVGLPQTSTRARLLIKKAA